MSAAVRGLRRRPGRLDSRYRPPGAGPRSGGYFSGCPPVVNAAGAALIRNDIVVFGLIAATLGAVFWT
ncbi:hypothetical protein L2249_06980, partial [Xanthomonas perforans]|nr:hypothetical protein [Xanthomonas perforans]